jgi:O-antigen/teichoic acid export membrane protein
VRALVLLLLASGLPVCVNFALTPLITASMSTSEYGQYVNYLTLSAVVNVMVGLSSAGYVSNAYIHPEAASRIVSSMIGFMGATLLPGALLAGGAAQLAKLPGLAISAALTLAAALAFVNVAFQTFVILRRQYGNLLVLAVAQTTAQSAVVSVLLISRHLDLWGLVLGHLAGFAVAGLCALVLWRRLGIVPHWPDRQALRAIFLYGAPLVPHTILSLASGSFDRWYLLGLGRTDVLAVYGVALMVASAVPLLLDVANKIYSPMVFERLKACDHRVGTHVARMARFVALGLLVAGLAALAGYWFVVVAFDTKYREAAWLCVQLAMASGTFVLYYAAAPYLFFFNKTLLVLLASAAGAVVTAALSLALVGSWALQGLIAGKCAGFVVSGAVALACAASLLGREPRESTAEVA